MEGSGDGVEGEDEVDGGQTEEAYHHGNHDRYGRYDIMLDFLGTMMFHLDRGSLVHVGVAWSVAYALTFNLSLSLSLLPSLLPHSPEPLTSNHDEEPDGKGSPLKRVLPPRQRYSSKMSTVSEVPEEQLKRPSLWNVLAGSHLSVALTEGMK